MQLIRQPACNQNSCAVQSPQHLRTTSAPGREQSEPCSGADVGGQHIGSENGVECALPMPLPWVQPTQEDPGGSPAERLPDADAGMALAQALPHSTASGRRSPLVPLHGYALGSDMH
jgi:hypothetical protein